MSNDGEDDVVRYSIEAIDTRRPAKRGGVKREPTKRAEAIAEILSKYPCCNGRVPPPVLEHHHHNHNHNHNHRKQEGGRKWQQQQQQQQRTTAHDGLRSRHRPVPVMEGGWQQHQQQQHEQRSHPRIRVGEGTDAERALRSHLNKLNERNFEAVRDGVLALIAAGTVDAATAAQAMLAKSVDDSSFAGVYARLLASIADRGAAVGTTVGAFLSSLFGAGDELWGDVQAVSSALAVASPTEAYDAFCAAVKEKKRLLGRHGTALAVLSFMAKSVDGAPKPADAADALMSVLGKAAERRDAFAVDLTLDLVKQLMQVLETTGASAPRAPKSHSAALNTVRHGVRTLLPEALLVSSEFGPKVRFKALDMLAAEPPKRPRGVVPTSSSSSSQQLHPSSKQHQHPHPQQHQHQHPQQHQHQHPQQHQQPHRQIKPAQTTGSTKESGCPWRKR